MRTVTPPKQPVKPARKRHGPSTEKKILTAAEKLFARCGFDGVTTKQLAEEAGVANGAIFHHFSSKEELYGAAIKRVFASKSKLPKRIINSKGLPEDKIAQLIAWFVRLMVLDENFGLLLRREMLEPHPSAPSFVEKGLFDDSLTMFKQQVLIVDSNADADEAVATTLALIFGFANLKGIYAFFPAVKKTLETADEIAEHATSLLLHRLKT